MRGIKKHSIIESLIIITATALILTLTLLVYYLGQYKESDKFNDEISKIAFKDIVTNDGIESNDVSVNPIDHEALSARNEDYIGWLMVDGTEISYPVVQSKEELFYLRRNFDKKHSTAGTVFMDFQNSKDFSDTNTMIYGHNMLNGSMFEPLKYFLKNGFFEENRFITIYTPSQQLRYEIFAVYEVKASEVPYMPGVLDANELTDFLARIKKSALHSREIVVLPHDKILTLATCGYSIKNARIIIHAVRISD